MDLLLIQSQEHDKLPLAELNAVLECENIEGTVEKVTDGLILIKKLENKKSDDYYQILTKRLAYTHEINEVISIFNIADLEKEILNINWSKYIKENFAVRVKRFKSNIDTVETEKKLGSLILSSLDKNKISVKLKNPKSLIRLVAFENSIYLSINKFKLNKKHFENIKPHKRPFFYPGSMSPKLARCMVNLSRVCENDLVLDPFCGTGGILIEAGIIGCKIVGSDINWKMKNGTAVNLDHYGISNYRTFNVDIRELKMYEYVDAVVTDPPYGISTSTGNIKGNEIFKEFFHCIHDNMKDGAYLCMASPHYVDLNTIINGLNFELVEEYHIKMHRSLTRVISVIRKKSQ